MMWMPLLALTALAMLPAAYGQACARINRHGGFGNNNNAANNHFFVSDGDEVPRIQPWSWNDHASSAVVEPGCILRLYQHVNYGGDELVFPAGNNNFVSNWNDELSSYKCNCATAACPESHPNVYHDGDYCCQYDTEKTYAPEGELCDAGPISFTSTCCRQDGYTACATSHCSNYGEVLDIFTRNAQNEITLERSNKIATIPSLGMEYTVSFEVMATSFVNAWQSVIHFTANDANIAQYGDRNPAVWFWASPDGTSRLHICSAVSGVRNNCYNSRYLSTGEWISVEISQTLQDEVYVYQIQIDGESALTVTNSQPEAFTDVSVYSADPWHAALNGQIRNLYVNPSEGAQSSTGGSVFCAEGMAIKLFNNKVVPDVATRDLCVALCRDETEFACRSVDYQREDHACKMSVKNRETAGDAYTSDYPEHDYCELLEIEAAAGEIGCSYEHVGCWQDSVNGDVLNTRTIALETAEWRGTGFDNVASNCFQRSLDNGYPGFALQGNGACRADMNIMERYDMIGPADNCGTDGTGWNWANDVYRIVCNEIEAAAGEIAMEAELPLVKDTVIGSIDVFPEVYHVEFDVKANSFVNAWQSVIHFTSDNQNINSYGSRNPAVWFHGSGSDQSRLHICSAVNGNKNHCYNSGPISVGTWVNVQILQRLSDGNHLREILLDGEVVHSVQNDQPISMRHVVVYAADPWHATLDGVIRNLHAADACFPVTCENGGSCSLGVCTCADGFSGETCQTDDACVTVTCENGGSCSLGACTCTGGFSGATCQTDDACVPVTCENGGSCSLGACTCTDGFSGDTCQIDDACTTVTCYNGGSCSLGDCTCADGYSGDTCQTDDACVPVTCENGGSCSLGVCTCTDAFSGATCQIDDACVPITCENGGLCSLGDCTCTDGFSGDTCQIDDACVPVTCENGGTCSLGVCTCADLYIGDFCESMDIFRRNSQNDFTLVRSNTISTLPSLGMEYTVSFEVMATSFVNAWQSVIHFTANDANNAQYGDRNPAVWFWASTDGFSRLHICSAVSGVRNNCYNSKYVLQGEWISVVISQTLQDEVYVYQIQIQGDVVLVVVNSQPEAFTDVSVYSADPWHAALNGQIRNLYVNPSEGAPISAAQTSTDIAMEEELPLVKDTVIGSLDVLAEEYHVEFDVKANSFVNAWQSVIHFTSDNQNINSYGSRNPAVWFHASGSDESRLHICSAVNGNKNYCYNSGPISVGTWVNVQIVQSLSDGNHLYEILLDGEVVHSTQNDQPIEVRHVVIYAADPWHAALDGVIRNLHAPANRCLFGLADVTSRRTDNERTALHHAGRYNHPECIVPLLAADAVLDSEDNNNQTPLSLAAWKNQCEAIRELVRVGADGGRVSTAGQGNIRNCLNDFTAEYHLRLTGGDTESEGRIEVYHEGEWGTVCDDYFQQDDADMVCQTLGYLRAQTVFGEPASTGYNRVNVHGFGDNADPQPIFWDDVDCSDATTLAECVNRGWGSENCGHHEDAAVVCSDDLYSGGVEVRLIGGNTASEGRIEVYHEEQWGTVCDDYFQKEDGDMVCKALGYRQAAKIFGEPGSTGFNQVNVHGFGDNADPQPIGWDDVNCGGDPATLADCVNRGWGIENCGHHEDAAVICTDDCFEYDTDFMGADLNNGATTGVASAAECQTLCLNKNGCTHFTWVSPSFERAPGIRLKCHLKNGMGERMVLDTGRADATGLVSGPARC